MVNKIYNVNIVLLFILWKVVKMNNYISFKDDFMADLTLEELKEYKEIKRKYDIIFKQWEEQLEIKQKEPGLPIDVRNLKEHELAKWTKINDDMLEETLLFYEKVQERRFTEIIKTVGIEKFFKDRIKSAEEAIKKIEEEKESPTRIYTDYALNSIIDNYKEVIKTSKEVLDKLQSIDSNNIQDLSFSEVSLSFSELLDAINIKSSSIEGKEEIELLNSIIPQNYIIPNNRLINKMVKGEVPYNKEFELRINKEAAKKKIITKVSLNYDDENIQIYDKDKRFTPYDRTVHNAVCSLFEAGNTNFTPDQVYRAMNGLDDQQYVSPQSVGAITRSLDKQRQIYAKVDYTNEAKAYRKDVRSCIVEDHILSAKKITLEAGGHKVTGYKLNNKPILYEYAQLTGQILTVPSKLLNTKDVIRSTEDVIIIREYLIRRIEVMKKNKDQSNRILLERVYEELNEPEPTKETSRKVRNIIDALLKKYVTEKYIKDYKYFKEGRAFKGIEIFY